VRAHQAAERHLLLRLGCRRATTKREHETDSGHGGRVRSRPELHAHRSGRKRHVLPSCFADWPDRRFGRHPSPDETLGVRSKETRRMPPLRSTLPRLWEFALEHLLLLPVGASIALVWANAAPESYYRVTYAIAFAVNDVAMVFFFALVTKEVVEATAPGGVLYPWRRASLPAIAALAATALSALIHVRV